MLVLGPIQRASHARGLSFDPVGLCTRTRDPQAQRAERSGGRPYRALYGILPLSARVTV